MELMPGELQCLILAEVPSPRNLRASCRGLLWVVDECTTSLLFRDASEAMAPSTEKILHLL